MCGKILVRSTSASTRIVRQVSFETNIAAIRPDDLQDCLEKCRQYGYEICYNLLKIEGGPFQSPYRKGKQFDLNGTKDQTAYYNKNTWVVKVRFAEYMKELQWQWSNELAVVECTALAETDFEIQVNTIGQKRTRDKASSGFCISEEVHEALCTLDGVDATL